ncbi:MAG TPA: hypothetical protein VJP45_02220, partial [Candidatus Limnocylindria bacterium]|nr:hypothetical protein [Candidatus Limnocylindria bacterium]
MRGVVFVIAAIVVTAGVIVAYDKVRPAGERAASQGVSPQSADPAHELASRLLLPTYYGQQDNAKWELQLFPAALPPDPKIDLPLPTGARLVGSVLRIRNGAPASLDAVLDVPTSTTDVPGMFERELGKLGWSPAPNRGPMQGGGFVPAVVGSNRMFCKGENPPWYSVTVFTPSSAPQDVRAHIDFIHPAIGTGNTWAGPCSTQNQAPSPGGPNKLPALRAPDGVRLGGGMGGMSGNDRQTSEANATTKLSAGDLEAAFAQQLSAAGWTRLARGADGPVAWSTWKLPGEGDWRGVLFINETGADR